MNLFAKLLNELPHGVKFLMAEEFEPACLVAFEHEGVEFSASIDKFDGTVDVWQIAPQPRKRVTLSELRGEGDSAPGVEPGAFAES